MDFSGARQRYRRRKAGQLLLLGRCAGRCDLTRSGAGLVKTYRYILEEDLKNGDPVELTPQFGGSSRPFTLLYPYARHLSLRVRTFVDFLMENLQPARR